MMRGLITGFVLSVVGLNAAAVAAPLSLLPSSDASLELGPTNASACNWLESASIKQNSPALADAFDAMGEICFTMNNHDADLLARATNALHDWLAALGTNEASRFQARFFRALAALEAQADLFAAGGEAPEFLDPALMLEPFAAPLPENALFTLEEATVPFLGPSGETATTVMIAVTAPGYEDLFTIYFPRGSAHLTLPAEDMIALAAEAVRDFPDAEVWVAAHSALTAELAFDRMSAVQDILLQNEIPGRWIHVDDGGIDAIMNRPESLAGDTEA